MSEDAAVAHLMPSHGLQKCRTSDEPLDAYNITPHVRIVIYLRRGRPFYCVVEEEGAARKLAQEVAKKALFTHIINNIDKVDYNIIEETTREVCSEYENECADIGHVARFAQYYTEAMLYSYGPLYPLILDPYVEEIAVDPPLYRIKVITQQLGPIWVETNIKLEKLQAERLIVALARRSGRDLSLAHPYTEGLLPEGHRLAATLGREVTRHGSSLVIRKHKMKPLSIVELIKNGTMSVELAAFLWLLVEARRSIIIAGPTASGKTTLLQSILDFVPPWSRVVSVEDTPELNLSHHPNWDSLVARASVSEESEDIDLYKLAKFSLRRRPDYLVIGEVRGEEARVLAYAASSGHAAYTTMHADNARTAVTRLLQEPFNVPRALLGSIDAIVVINRIPGVGRRIVEVAEIDGDTPRSMIPVTTLVSFSQNTAPPLLSFEAILEESLTLRKIGLDKDILLASFRDKVNIIRSSKSREELLENISNYYLQSLISNDKLLGENA